MKPLAALIRSSLWWLVPLAMLSALIGYETQFGRALRMTPPRPAAIEPKPVTTALLPEYEVAGGVAARRETVERALFTPTRRPAPPLVAPDAAKPRMQRGQFALTGTIMVDGKNTAFLRETNGGRSRRVSQGDTLNGMVVAEVMPDRVKLAMGDEVEELPLRVSQNPRPTPQAPLPGAPVVGQPAPVAAAPLPTPPVAVPTTDVAQTLAERRRAARAAQAASTPATPEAAVPPNMPAPAGTNGAVAPAGTPPAGANPRTSDAGNPTWNDVYQRYQYRTR